MFNKIIFSVLLLVAFQNVNAQECLVGNCENGYGRQVQKNKDTIEAIFKDKKIEYGRVYFKNCNQYEGFLNTKGIEGHGVLKKSDGGILIGYFQKNEFKEGFELKKETDDWTIIQYKPNGQDEVPIKLEVKNLKVTQEAHSKYIGQFKGKDEVKEKSGFGIEIDEEGLIEVGIFRQNKFYMGYSFLPQNINPNDAIWGNLEIKKPMDQAQENIYLGDTGTIRAQPGFDWSNYILKNLKYPIAARDAEKQGSVLLKFEVQKDGKITNITTTNEKLGYGLDEEAIRVVQFSPDWKPGRLNGKAVSSFMSVPITFKMEGATTIGNTQNSDVPGSSTIVAPVEGEEDVFTNLDQRPEPGFDWAKYMSKNVSYPREAWQNEIEGRVLVKFVVEKDGSITNVRIVKNNEIGYGIPKEAIRVIKNSPKWKPGIKDGKPVRSYMTVPISFRLESKPTIDNHNFDLPMRLRY
ncbi:MAG TPA: energy transducer TonB [Edaphocola sp.]|nr:energy transducer TonB [Edaphocola sp.]